MSSRIRRIRRSQGGFSLIEVLIALLVTSFGLLGLAALQTVSLKHNHNAYLRSQATFLAHDLIERMRANRGAAISGSYDVAFGGTPAGGGVAGDDLDEWLAEIARQLPDGEGEVDVQAVGIATVSVRWEDARGDAGAENPEAGEPLVFTVTTEL